MSRLRYALGGITLLGIAVFYILTAPRASNVGIYEQLTANPAAGESVFWAAGCASCHMAPGALGADQLILAGGQEFPSDFGTFVAPNISPDKENGIGGWSVEDFSHAITCGISPSGQHYFPALPYAAYGKMLPQDVVDLKAYMDGLPNSAATSQPHKVGFPFNIRRNVGIWKLMFFSGDYVLQGDLTPPVERGRYIAEALAHCGECHTPRNILGGLDTSRWLGGAPNPSGKGEIPNITPGKLKWSEDEIVAYLTTGFTPDFDSVGGHMAHVVENMARLPESDRAAVAAYLKAVPAVE